LSKKFTEHYILWGLAGTYQPQKQADNAALLFLSRTTKKPPQPIGRGSLRQVWQPHVTLFVPKPQSPMKEQGREIPSSEFTAAALFSDQRDQIVQSFKNL